MTTLSNRLRTLKENRDISANQIAKRATAAGYQLSQSTVSRYLAGQHPEHAPTEILDGFAYALGVSPETLYKAAGTPARKEPFNLPADAALLDEHERQAVLGVVHAFIRTKHQLSTNRQAPAARSLYEDEEYLQTHLGIAAKDQSLGDDIDEIYE